ncbi:MAG TPA: aminoacyl-tRNA hydrolase [Alphaproteobacteria bacterium]|nr:aminoacyl-tRNA hydrolase [Alphaproteobacteria bacterium]
MTKVFVGLGNPGPSYMHNRHNVGFIVVDFLQQAFSPYKPKFNGLLSEGILEREKIYFFKPTTYMNLSGQAVVQLLKFYQISTQDVCVIHDDLALEPLDIRIKTGGGNAGHNGLKSLDSSIGKDYTRLRIGIGHPGVKDLVSDFVLSNFSRAELLRLREFLDRFEQNPLGVFEKDPQRLSSYLQSIL